MTDMSSDDLGGAAFAALWDSLSKDAQFDTNQVAALIQLSAGDGNITAGAVEEALFPSDDHVPN
jgi:hypothetical protein